MRHASVLCAKNAIDIGLNFSNSSPFVLLLQRAGQKTHHNRINCKFPVDRSLITPTIIDNVSRLFHYVRIALNNHTITESAFETKNS